MITNGAIPTVWLKWLNTSQCSSMAKSAPQYEERLEQIAHTAFGVLSDDQILQLLAERKQLQMLKLQYEEAQKEQEQLGQVKKEKEVIEKELDRLNALISPDKPDDELIHLIEERKTWEAKLAAVNETLAGSGMIEESPALAAVSTMATEAVQSPEEKTEAPVESIPETPEEVSIPVSVTPKASSSMGQEGILKTAIDKDFGEHKIFETTIDPNSELGQFLERMESNPESMGTILDDLPVAAKRDKAFMLAVAEIDPAYAMHYADKDVLKKDEDFNLRLVSIKGKRQSGSVLAEMLPEARTEAVVMEALKQDYRNVRFVLPQMQNYDKMLEKAKKAALEKVKELKESVDVMLLIPKILQKDKVFMEKVEKIAPHEDK